jgi:hypothetical protein
LDKENKIILALNIYKYYLLEDTYFIRVTPEIDLNSLDLGLDFSDLGPLFPISASKTLLSGGGSLLNT